MHARGGFFRNALDGSGKLGEPTGLGLQAFFDEGEEDFFFLIRRLVQERGIALFGAQPVMDQQRHVTAVIQQDVRLPAIGPFQRALHIFPVFREGFALHGENRRAGFGNGGSGVVLG